MAVETPMKTAPVTLIEPVARAGGEVTEIVLRRPTVGALRGLKMSEVLQMDVGTISTLLPRITEPALVPDEVAALSPPDFLELATLVVAFFMSPAARAEAERLAAG